VQLLHDTTDAFTSQLAHQDSLITNLPATTTAIKQCLQASVINSITTTIATNLATDPLITSLIHDIRDLCTKCLLSLSMHLC
jgi:hypothetical protein